VGQVRCKAGKELKKIAFDKFSNCCSKQDINLAISFPFEVEEEVIDAFIIDKKCGVAFAVYLIIFCEHFFHRILRIRRNVLIVPRKEIIWQQRAICGYLMWVVALVHIPQKPSSLEVTMLFQHQGLYSHSSMRGVLFLCISQLF